MWRTDKVQRARQDLSEGQHVFRAVQRAEMTQEALVAWLDYTHAEGIRHVIRLADSYSTSMPGAATKRLMESGNEAAVNFASLTIIANKTLELKPEIHSKISALKSATVGAFNQKASELGFDFMQVLDAVDKTGKTALEELAESEIAVETVTEREGVWSRWNPTIDRKMNRLTDFQRARQDLTEGRQTFAAVQRGLMNQRELVYFLDNKFTGPINEELGRVSLTMEFPELFFTKMAINGMAVNLASLIVLADRTLKLKPEVLSALIALRDRTVSAVKQKASEVGFEVDYIPDLDKPGWWGRIQRKETPLEAKVRKDDEYYRAVAKVQREMKKKPEHHDRWHDRDHLTGGEGGLGSLKIKN